MEKTNLNIRHNDFTKIKSPTLNSEKVDFLVCNPPYVRHHHMNKQEKTRLKRLVLKRTDIPLSGLAGLYCYYLLIADSWMKKDGLACWLIPSEFMDVNYGKAIKDYLLNKVTLLRIHRFDPENVQFHDAVVSSCLVWFKKTKPSTNHKIEFTFGNDFSRPEEQLLISRTKITSIEKWSNIYSPYIATNSSLHLGDLFTIKRGIATGDNSFFILNKETISKYEISEKFIIPVLPSPRFLRKSIIESDDNGEPIMENPKYLLSCELDEDVVKNKYPNLWKYLSIGVHNNVNQRYLCAHRSVWFHQEKRMPPPILFTYMSNQRKGSNSFRFILNKSRAIATNSYLLLYPTIKLQKILGQTITIETVWKEVNKKTETISRFGRTYGGALSKLEPKELERVTLDININ